MTLCGRRPFSRDEGASGSRALDAFAGCRFTDRGQAIQPTSRATFFRRQVRGFPSRFDQAHLFEAAERAIEGPVRGEEPSILDVLNLLRDLVTVELLAAALLEPRRSAADGDFERDE
jgi:hypothetical protein